MKLSSHHHKLHTQTGFSAEMIFETNKKDTHRDITDREVAKILNFDHEVTLIFLDYERNIRM